MKRLLWLFVFLFIAFIFYNSSLDAIESSNLSQGFVAFLLNFIKIPMDLETFEHLIRKLAHFTEFAALGFMVYLAQKNYPITKKNSLIFLLFACTGIIDENIQRFSEGRACTITDMMIDTSGYIFGLIVGILFLSILLKWRKSHV